MAKRQNGGREMVLEGRHVLVVFFAIVVLSAVFFTLGYVLGRMQGEMRTAGTATGGRRPAPSQPASKAAPADSGAGASPADLSFYQAVEKKGVDTELARPGGLATKAAPPPGTAPAAKPPANKAEAPARVPAHAPGIALQVAALLRREDAESMAEVLRHKKYPVLVVPPSSDQFYRVQVGPFATEQAASQMRKRLEDDGFKVITKR